MLDAATIENAGCTVQHELALERRKLDSGESPSLTLPFAAQVVPAFLVHAGSSSEQAN